MNTLSVSKKQLALAYLLTLIGLLSAATVYFVSANSAGMSSYMAMDSEDKLFARHARLVAAVKGPVKEARIVRYRDEVSNSNNNELVDAESQLVSE